MTTLLQDYWTLAFETGGSVAQTLAAGADQTPATLESKTNHIP